MKKCWQIKKLDDVCRVVGGGTPSKHKTDYYAGDIPWATVRDMRKEIITDTEYKITKQAVASSTTNIIPKGNVVIATRVGLGKVCMLGQDTAINQDLRGIIPHDTKTLVVRFLFWWFKSISHLIEKEGTGATVKGVRLPFIKALQLPLPSFHEQQRIVGILDGAFESIATAKANAEKNLQNSRALFESYLESVFDQAGKRWGRKPLSSLAMFRNGINYTKDSEGEQVKVVGVKNFQNNFYAPLDKLDTVTIDGTLSEPDSLRQDDVLAVRSNGNVDLIGRCLLVGKVVGKISHSGFTIRIRVTNGELLPKYLCYFMKSASTRKRLTDGGTGTNIKSLNQKILSMLVIPFPLISEQKFIVAKLESISDEARRLAALYERKVAVLEELKKSLLQKAFAGELTAQSQVSVAVQFPTKISNITTTDLHAGILAMAYELHEKNGTLKYFGHVKAEKISHMVEAHLGIDLGRAPIKDAAGPSDHPHLKRVEHRAKMGGFFEFQRVAGSGYWVKKYRRFDELIKRSRESLRERTAQIDNMLKLMLALDTQQAEIFATVYAAWNNLLLHGHSVTDERIVREAREDWHPDKLEIPRNKFFAALSWMRERGIIPSGQGKEVVAKKSKS